MLATTNDVDKAGKLLRDENPKKGVFKRKRKEEGVVLGYIKKGMTSNVSHVLPSVKSTECTEMDYDWK